MGGRMIPYDDIDMGYYDDPWQSEVGSAAGGNPLFDDGPPVHLASLVGHHTATAAAEYDGLVGFGDAKRNKGEVFQDGVGRDLAEGRALIDLGRALVDRAYEALGDPQ